MKRSEIIFSVLLIPLDYAALLAAFILSYYLRDEFTFFSPTGLTDLASRLSYNPAGNITLPFAEYLRYVNLIVPGMVVIFAIVGLYSLRSTLSWPKRFMNILIGISMGEFFILFLFLLKKDFFIPRSTVLYSWILSIIFVVGSRAIVRFVQKRLYAFNVGTIQVGVIGEGAAAKRVIGQLCANSANAYRLAVHIPHMGLDKTLETLKQHRLDELVVVNKDYSSQGLVVLRNYCLEEHIGFSFIPALLTELESNFDIRTVAGLPVIEVNPTPLEGWGRVIKRLFDIVVGLCLIVIFSPFFLIIALAIKLTSPGPLIYRHMRIGKNGIPIAVWKFRSMEWKYCTGSGYDGDALFAELLKKHPSLAEEWKRDHKLKNDPRISRIGHILRKTSLDELPQFFNVIGGSLSLVGPRPIVQDEIAKYGDTARILFTVKPGLTGPWQIGGRNDTTYNQRIAMDSHYIEHWNLWSDVAILIKTAAVLLRKNKSGAY